MPEQQLNKRGDNHRRFPRFRLGVPVQYKFLEQGDLYRALESHTENFSAKGTAFLTDRRIHSRKHILLTLYLPSGDHYKRNLKKAYPEENLLPVIIFSEVAWCRRKNQRHFEIGVEFLAVEPEHVHRFESFLFHALA
ncbi:PilZ domain-containing protein [bacterium]|nr:PilZ domain-containing protein [bacterium]